MTYPPSDAPPVIRHNTSLQRFECTVDGELCVADYRRIGRTMQMTHTGVPPALQGRGIAAALVAAALFHAREQGWTVEPLCSYVAAYLRRHPAEAPSHPG